MLILALGAGLIAQESLAAARALDWMELRIRRVLAWGRDAYRNASPGGRVLLVMATLLATGALAVGAYRILFGAADPSHRSASSRRTSRTLTAAGGIPTLP